ncbi:MAG: glycosyltransferase family 2 protein [Candidatus Hodarchaeota archaeon]
MVKARRNKPVFEKKLENSNLYKRKSAPDIPELSIIIPAYNEERTIGNLIEKITKTLSQLEKSTEIIVINDGSTDQTQLNAEKSGKRVINLEKNMGKATALRTGFRASSGSTILTIDADGSHCMEDLKKLIEEYYQRDVDMLIGSRFINSIGNQFTSPMKMVGNYIIKYILFLLSGNFFTDSLSGMRIFDRKIIDSFSLVSNGFEIESELTAKSIGAGFKVTEFPITIKPRAHGNSHLNSFKDGIRITSCIIRSYLKGKKLRKEN